MAEDVGGPGNGVRTARWRAAALLVVGSLLASAGTAVASSAPAGAQGAATSATATVWLCQPGAADDPCASSLTTTVVQASGAIKEVSTQDDNSSPFDCFYVYPTVSKQKTTNANLKVQRPEIDAAVYEASRFSTVCKVWAPMYRQVTLAGLAAHLDLDLPPSATDTAFDSLQSAFEDYLAHDNDGRPIVFIGHSQGAAMLILLLKRLVDDNPTLRNRTVLAIILGGNVEVKTGSEVGGSFSHIPVCDSNGEAGCVIAYSTFPGTPPIGLPLRPPRPGRLAPVRADRPQRPAGCLREPGRRGWGHRPPRFLLPPDLGGLDAVGGVPGPVHGQVRARRRRDLARGEEGRGRHRPPTGRVRGQRSRLGLPPLRREPGVSAIW